MEARLIEIDIFLKCTGKIISKTDQGRLDARSKVFFGKNAWLDTPLMMNISERFFKHIVGVCGADTCVLFFCDHFKAHVNYQVQNILDMQRCSCITFLRILQSWCNQLMPDKGVS